MPNAKPAIRFHPALVTWGLLMLATALSWWLGTDHGLPMGGKALAMSVIAVVAFVKVYLVSMYFMELRHAPRILKHSFNGWTVLTCALVVGLYLAAA